MLAFPHCTTLPPWILGLDRHAPALAFHTTHYPLHPLKWILQKLFLMAGRVMALARCASAAALYSGGRKLAAGDA